jgi:probable HAF family extracellular repeat protein
MLAKFMSACLFAFCTAQPALAAPPSYTYTPYGGKYTSVVAMNERGEVALNNHEAYIPNRASLNWPGGYIDYGTLGGMNTEVYGINNRGGAVGVSDSALGGQRAFLYSDGTMREFTPSRDIGPPTLINDRGDVAGSGYDRPFLYSQGKLARFGTTNSRVSDINEAGVVVGALNFPGEPGHPFLYSDGKLTDLTTLGWSSGTASAVNDLGAAVGFGATDAGVAGAFLYENGVMRLLDALPAGAMPSDINNLGDIVGIADGRPFLYRDGELFDVDGLLPPGRNFALLDAREINDRQQILAGGCFTGNDAPSGCFGAVLTPVPEPRSWLMLLAGALAITARRYRRGG